MFRILALAGGGIRGAFAIGFLAELEKRLARPLSDYFDLISGTSTGAITAASLCRGTTATELQEFYHRHSSQIFHKRDPHVPRHYLRPFYPLLRRSLLRWMGRNIDDLFRSRYCPTRLSESMLEGFNDERMQDATKCRLIIPGVNLTKGETCVFRTPHLPIKRSEYDWRIADIIVAATAAPTFFPHKELPDGSQYCDGGLWAIDPGVVALAESVRIMEACERSIDPKFDMSDVHMLSIGTGEATYSLSPPGADAGMLFWSRHLAEVISVSQVQGTQLPLRVVLGNRYRQVNFKIEDRTWTLDNTAITDRLFKLGKEAGIKLFDQLQDQFFREATIPYQPYL